jgi:signal transduction histidine kinase
LQGLSPAPWWILFFLLWMAGLALILLFYDRDKKRLSILLEIAEQVEHSPQLYDRYISGDDEMARIARSIRRLGLRISREEELRSQLIADVAHELRTPLTILRGQLESLSAREQINSAQLLPLIDETIRMSRLIQDLQQLSLAEAGKLSLNRSWIQLSPWLEELIEVLKMEAERKQIVLDVTQTVDREVYWDSSRMKQVFLNLIGNSIQYTPQGGKILISAGEREGIIHLKIQDNGPGIPPEKLPYIFQRFYRVEGSRNRLSGGTGLGLAIAKEFVEAHEGRIGVESELGEGTRFTIQIPVFPES